MDVERIRTMAAVALGFAFILIGVDHFLRTAWYVPIVPEVLGFPEFWMNSCLLNKYECFLRA